MTKFIKDFEDILEHTGGFGKFQFLVLVIVLGFEIPVAFIGFIPVFTGTLPEYWICDGEEIGKTEAASCNGTLAAPTPFTSVVAEWNLVGEYAWVSDSINSAQMIGMNVGVLLCSWLSDWYGRKYSCFGSGVFLALGSIISATAPNPYVYGIGRVICGAAFSALLNLTGIYALEFLPVTKRSFSACAGPYGWGTVILVLIAYFVRPWRTLAWITTTPLLIFCPLLLIFVPESPRFLMRKGRVEEAAEAINCIARFNGCEEIDVEVIRKIAESEQGNTSDSRASYLDLFRRSDLRGKTLCLCSIWFAWAMLYFGLFFNVKNLPGDIYLGALCLGGSDVIGFPAALLIMDRYGRRRSVVMTMSLGAVVMATLAGLQLALDLRIFPIVILLLCTLAKFFLGMARSATKCFTAESFPTDIRTIGAGCCSVPIGIGAAISSQVVFLGSIEPSSPFFVFAAVGIFGSIFSLFMKETSGKPLQESVARKLSRRISIISSMFLPSVKEMHT